MKKYAKKLNNIGINKRVGISILHIIYLSYFVTTTYWILLLPGRARMGGLQGRLISVAERVDLMGVMLDRLLHVWIRLAPVQLCTRLIYLRGGKLP